MNLWFLTDSIIRWTPERLRAVNTESLGGGVDGAEAMTVGLCRHLAASGCDVTLWATQCDAPGRYDGGIRWRSVERDLRHALVSEPSPDVFVSVRRPEVFAMPEYQLGCRSAFRLLWAHDILDDVQGLTPSLQNVDAVVYMSAWHRQQWEAVHPPMATRNFFGWLTPAAFEPAWLPNALSTDHDRTTFIYGSRPERGLGPLLEMWPELRRRIPGATLIVTGYTAGTQSLVSAADRGIEQVNARVGGIEVARSPDKRGFYRQLRRARFLLYPGVAWFEETNGHVCSEAMVCGTVPFVTRIGALPGTIPAGAGVLFEGDASTSAYQQAFIDRVVEMSAPAWDDRVKGMREIGFRHVIDRCSYAAVAELWTQGLSRLPQARKALCLS